MTEPGKVGAALLFYDFLERIAEEATTHARRLRDAGLTSYAEGASKMVLQFKTWQRDLERGWEEAKAR